ncbi:MAG: DNA repair protein RecO, partial [Ilumatobacteraceae bacterium]
KGVRKTKSRFGGRLEPLCHLSLLMHEGRNLDVVSQVETIDSPAPLLGDLDRLTQGLAIVEAVAQIALDREPAPGVYRMLVGALRTLETRPSPVVVPAFYWKLLAAEGVQPQLDACVSCGAAEPAVVLVAFDMNEGGVLCRSCRRGRPVSPEALRITRMILGGQLNAAIDEPASPATSEVGHLATAALEQHLERRLRSVAMFEREHPTGERPDTV